MARAAREKSETGAYSIMLEGSEKVFCDEADREHFLELADKYLAAVRAHAFTENFISMIASETEKGISADMKPLVTSYARYYNKKYGKSGKVFAQRFKSEPLNSKEEIENACALAASSLESIQGHKNGKKSKPTAICKTDANPREKKQNKKIDDSKQNTSNTKANGDTKSGDALGIDVKTKKKKQSLPSWLL